MSDRNEFFSDETAERVSRFQCEKQITSKGRLSSVIQFTRLVEDKEFPLNADDFKTDSEGQVAGLGGGNLKKILSEHGIDRKLSSEGGRTSRGSMGLMKDYVSFLNNWHTEGTVKLHEVENFWAEEVRKFFNNQPFILSSDVSRTVRANLNDLFNQARKREQENSGTRYLGVVLQHLVAAKLLLIMPEAQFDIHGASVADESTDRAGDFVVGKTAIHCTTMPGDLLMRKCQANIRGAYSPVIITIYERVNTTLSMLEDNGLAGRVEVWDIQQFLSSNVMEHSNFNESKRNATLADIITRYNKIIDDVETDPSLRIEFDG